MTGFGGYERKRMAQRSYNRVEKALAGTLGSDETLESAFFAHRYMPGLFILYFFGSIGDMLHLLIARPYYLVLTNQRFFLLNGSRWGWVSRPKDAVFVVPANAARLEIGRGFALRKVVKVTTLNSDEVRVAVHRQFYGELDHMRSLLGG